MSELNRYIDALNEHNWDKVNDSGSDASVNPDTSASTLTDKIRTLGESFQNKVSKLGLQPQLITPNNMLDGDTFRIDGVSTRLSRIDTPETHINDKVSKIKAAQDLQLALGNRAAQFGQDWLQQNPDTVITPKGTDIYGRQIGDNEAYQDAMLRSGNAVPFYRYDAPGQELRRQASMDAYHAAGDQITPEMQAMDAINNYNAGKDSQSVLDSVKKMPSAFMAGAQSTGAELLDLLSEVPAAGLRAVGADNMANSVSTYFDAAKDSNKAAEDQNYDNREAQYRLSEASKDWQQGNYSGAISNALAVGPELVAQSLPFMFELMFGVGGKAKAAKALYEEAIASKDAAKIEKATEGLNSLTLTDKAKDLIGNNAGLLAGSGQMTNTDIEKFTENNNGVAPDALDRARMFGTELGSNLLDKLMFKAETAAKPITDAVLGDVHTAVKVPLAVTAAGAGEAGQEYLQTGAQQVNQNWGAKGQTLDQVLNDPKLAEERRQAALGGMAAGANISGTGYAAQGAYDAVAKGSGYVNNKLETKAAFNAENPSYVAQNKAMQGNADLSPLLAVDPETSIAKGYVDEVKNEDGTVTKTPYNPLQRMADVINEFQDKHSKLTEIFNSPEVAEASGDATDLNNPEHVADMMYNALGTYNEKLDKTAKEATEFATELLGSGKLTEGQRNAINGQLKAIEQAKIEFQNEENSTLVKYYDQYINKTDDPTVQAKAAQAQAEVTINSVTKNREDFVRDPERAQTALDRLTKGIELQTSSDSEQRVAAKEVSAASKKLLETLRGIKAREDASNPENSSGSSSESVSRGLHGTPKGTQYSGKLEKGIPDKTIYKVTSEILFGTPSGNKDKHRGVLQATAQVAKYNAILSSDTSTASAKYNAAEKLHDLVDSLTKFHDSHTEKLKTIKNRELKEHVRSIEIPAIAAVLNLAKKTASLHKDTHTIAAEDIMDQVLANPKNTDKHLYSEYRNHAIARNNELGWKEPSDRVAEDTIRNLLTRQSAELRKRATESKNLRKANIESLHKPGAVKTSTFTAVDHNGETQAVNLSSFVDTKKEPNNSLVAFGEVKQTALDSITSSDTSKNSVKPVTISIQSDVILGNDSYQKAVEELAAEIDSKPSAIQSAEDAAKKAEANKTVRESIINAVMRLAKLGTEAVNDPRNFIARISADDKNVKRLNNINDADNPNGIVKPLKLLLGLSAQNKLTLPPNVALAASAAVLEYIKSSGSTIGYRTDDDVMKAFGIPFVNSDPVAQMSMSKLKSLGTLRSVAAKEIGRTIYNALNLKMKGDAPSNLEAQLIGALGGLAIEMAVADGILAYREIPVEDLQTDIKNAGGPGQKVKDKDAKVGFITYNRKNKDSNTKLREELRDAGSVFKAVLGEAFVSRKTGATLEPDAKVTAKANKGLDVPAAIVKVLTKIAEKTTYKFNPQAMNNLYTDGKVDWDKAVNVVTSITGLPNLTAEVLRYENARDKWAKDNFNISIRDFQKSILEGELLQIAKLDEAVNNLGGYDIVVSEGFPGFKLPRIVWKQGRVGIESSDINIQESKLHRSMVQVTGTYTKVSGPKGATSNYNLTRLAVLAGVDEKKSPYEVVEVMNSINTELKDLVATDTGKLITAIKAFNENPTVETAQAIKKLLPEGSLLEKAIEDGYDGITGAYELGNTILAMVEPTHTYESRINIETDGVTNGFGFSLAFNPIFSDPQNTISYLEKVGINFYGEAGVDPVTNGIQAAREKAKNGGTPFTDSYQTLASALVAALRGDTSVDLSKLSKLFPKIFILNGDMYDIARDFTKNPFMVFNYGSAIKSIKEGVKTNLYYKLLGEISKAQREGDIARLNDIAKTLFNSEAEQKKFMSNPLEYKLERSILDNMTAPVADHMGNIIEQQIGDLILPKEIVNATFNRQMAIYRQVMKYELDKVRGDSNRVLTVDEVKAVIDKVSPFIPRFNHIDDYISGRGKDKFKEGWPAFKLQPGDTTNTEIEMVFSTSTQKSMKYNVSDKELAEAGVSGYVLMVHNADGHVMTQSLSKLVDQDISVLDVHDAVKVGAQQIEPAATELNTAFGDVVSKYSIVDNALQSLEGAYEKVFQEYGLLFGNDRANMVRLVHKTLDKESDTNGIFDKIAKYNKNLAVFNKLVEDRYADGTLVISQYAGLGGKGNIALKPSAFIKPLINIADDSILALGRDTSKSEANAMYAAVEPAHTVLPVDQDKLDEVVNITKTAGPNDNVLSTIGTMLETGLVSNETHRAVLSTLLDQLSLIQAGRERKTNKTQEDTAADAKVANAMKVLKGITQTNVVTNKEVLAGIKTLLTAYFDTLLKSGNKDTQALKAIKHIVPLLSETAGINARVNANNSNLGEILASVFTAPENFEAVANSQIMARDATLKAQPSSITFKVDKAPVEGKVVTPSMITHLKRALTDMFNGITSSDKGFKEYEENKTTINTMGELVDLIATVTANKTRNAEGDFKGDSSILARADIALSKVQDSARIDALKALHTKYLTEGDC
jgi:hypothetical protein